MFAIQTWLAVLLLVIPGAANSAGSPLGTVKPLVYGVTQLDLTGRGLPGMAVLAKRDNFNAHGFDVLTLYVKVSLETGDPTIWRLVPVFEKDSEQLTQHASGGADCLLHDFRLFTAPGERVLQLVVADREMGDSYANTEGVNFKFYELKQNTEGVPGRPLYYFEFSHSLIAKQKYCDVGVALKDELGFGQYLVQP